MNTFEAPLLLPFQPSHPRLICNVSKTAAEILTISRDRQMESKEEQCTAFPIYIYTTTWSCGALNVTSRTRIAIYGLAARVVFRIALAASFPKVKLVRW